MGITVKETNTIKRIFSPNPKVAHCASAPALAQFRTGNLQPRPARPPRDQTHSTWACGLLGAFISKVALDLNHVYQL
jgi:hypothetical protein